MPLSEDEIMCLSFSQVWLSPGRPSFLRTFSERQEAGLQNSHSKKKEMSIRSFGYSVRSEEITMVFSLELEDLTLFKLSSGRNRSLQERIVSLKDGRGGRLSNF